jgi:SlyX protein
MEERVTELETRLAFQEHTLQVLNDIVTAQQRQIEDLQHRAELLAERLRALQPSNIASDEEEIPPPHY